MNSGISDFERYIRKYHKKKKEIEDNRILDEILFDLKKKNEKEKQQHIKELTIKLEQVKG